MHQVNVLQVTVNGKVTEAEPGATILTALRGAGFDVPSVCHDPRMTAYGGCRLCVVKVKGMSRPVTACNTPLVQGMEIETHTPEIEGLRKTLLMMLARDYPAEQVRKFPEKQFHQYLGAYGVTATGGPDPARWMIRMRIFTWICRSVYRAIGACGFVMRCRGNMCGRRGIGGIRRRCGRRRGGISRRASA